MRHFSVVEIVREKTKALARRSRWDRSLPIRRWTQQIDTVCVDSTQRVV
jgi:hypothetical protein